MKKTLLLLVLALGMCSTKGFAQEKEYNVEDDGFEWYKIGTRPSYGALGKHGNTLIPQRFEYISYEKGIFVVRSNDKKGAYDTKGNMIIPTEYDYVLNMFYGIFVNKGNNWGVYNKFGRCLIPISRGYKEVFPLKGWWSCYHSKLGEKGKRSICDASGKVVFTTRRECESLWIQYDSIKKKYAIIVDNKFFVDSNDNVVLDPQCHEITHGLEGIDNLWIVKTKNGTRRKLTQAEKSKVIFSGDILSGNKEYFASLERMEKGTYTNNSPSSNNSNSNNSSSGNTTQTVVVEHHRDPVPFQEWQACLGCGGMGTMGCDNCGGSGTKYIGDRLHTCSRCNGRGIIPCNICFGNKGKYITVYR